MGRSSVVRVSPREAKLKQKLRRHLRTIGFTRGRDGALQIEEQGKEVIRTLHAAQREERLKANAAFLKRRAAKLIPYFAAGNEVDPQRISPVLERVSTTLQRDLFRFASLTWAVPVSNGFGRRIRYLVWDNHNRKLIGILAIGDPVFNLKVRDAEIGWDASQRGARLVDLMDAYVLGAVPPYNQLLGGKLVACLLRSTEVYEDFAKLYGKATGIISQKKKRARLLAITTSSSLGRSSVYNRLRLNGTAYMTSLGYTGGWGHFHIPDKLFAELRAYLRDIGHTYADLHRFGQGPNWRLRTTRAALDALGFRADMLKHGIGREVFISWLAKNGKALLTGKRAKADLGDLLPASKVAEQAVQRWMVPRAERRPQYRTWTHDDLLKLFGSQARSLQAEVKKVKRGARMG